MISYTLIHSPTHSLARLFGQCCSVIVMFDLLRQGAIACCRNECWWEQSAFQFKILLLLLVVVHRRPRGNYVQTLLFTGLLSGEFAYQVYS